LTSFIIKESPYCTIFEKKFQLMPNNFPQQTDVIIIGGGPSGSSAATHLARAGINVVVLEKTNFPRHQIGESLIPHFWKFTDTLGVSKTIEREGFITKAGGISAWKGKTKKILFSDFGYTRAGLHVERDIFDQLLLKHAQCLGAQVFQSMTVTRVDFRQNKTPIIVCVDVHKIIHKIQCRYVIDATGSQSLLARQLGHRKIISPEKNFLAIWGYFSDSRYPGVDARSHTRQSLTKISPVTFVMSYKEGWLWHIILRNKASVGLIVHSKHTKNKNKQQREDFFKDCCQSLPYIKDLLQPAHFIDGSIGHRSDYSCYSRKTCGENYYCIGDAAAFVDPIFSQGVQNAFYNGALASLAIKESFKNPAKRERYSQLCASRMQQYYNFSRALALGDFGANKTHQNLVQSLMRSMPPLELELMLVAAQTTDRSENFKQLAQQAGIWDNFTAQSKGEELANLTQLNF
jgi:flavin-dependent dehydrogenase